MTTKTVIEDLASCINARANCEKSGNQEWFEKHTERIEYIQENYLPSGSGLDSGCTVNLDKSTDKRIVIDTSFHHMNEVGMYDGWTDHTVILTPSFIGKMDIRITGRDRNRIKDYLHDTFYFALKEVVED